MTAIVPCPSLIPSLMDKASSTVTTSSSLASITNEDILPTGSSGSAKNNSSILGITLGLIVGTVVIIALIVVSAVVLLLRKRMHTAKSEVDSNGQDFSNPSYESGD